MKYRYTAHEGGFAAPCRGTNLLFSRKHPQVRGQREPVVRRARHRAPVVRRGLAQRLGVRVRPPRAAVGVIPGPAVKTIIQTGAPMWAVEVFDHLRRERREARRLLRRLRLAGPRRCIPGPPPAGHAPGGRPVDQVMGRAVPVNDDSADRRRRTLDSAAPSSSWMAAHRSTCTRPATRAPVSRPASQASQATISPA